MISFDQKTGEASIENERISKDGVEIAVLEGGTKKRLYLRGSEVPIPYEARCVPPLAQAPGR